MPERAFPASVPIVGRGVAAASFEFYLTGDEQLRITALNPLGPLSVDIGWRMWRETDRSLQLGGDSIVSGAPAGTLTKEFPLTAGAILTLRLGTSDTTINYGDVWVRADLVIGTGSAARIISTLLQGYISAQNAIAWPGSPLEKQQDARGVIRDVPWLSLAGPLRAEVTVDDFHRWRVIAGRVDLVTSALAGTRTMSVDALNAGGAPFFTAQAPIGQGPGIGVAWSIGAGLNQSDPTLGTWNLIPWPADLELRKSQTVRLTVTNALAGDALTVQGLAVRQWIDA